MDEKIPSIVQQGFKKILKDVKINQEYLLKFGRYQIYRSQLDSSNSRQQLKPFGNFQPYLEPVKYFLDSTLCFILA